MKTIKYKNTTDQQSTQPSVLPHVLGEEVEGGFHSLGVLGQHVSQRTAPVHAETARGAQD
jgi:hypothetical protein